MIIAEAGASEVDAMNIRILLVVAVVVSAPHYANGQIGWGGCPYSPCWGYGYTATYSAYYTESVPYYAINPPVYYSYRVARTYGYSPFPYPPGVLTPGSEMPRPVIVQNVYAPAEETEASEAVQPKPLRIENPYVQQPERSAVGAKSNSRHPQVVYPTAVAYRKK